MKVSLPRNERVMTIGSQDSVMEISKFWQDCLSVQLKVILEAIASVELPRWSPGFP